MVPKRAVQITFLLGASFLFALLLTAFQSGQPAQQTTVLYDGALGGTPDTQSFSYLALAAATSQTYTNGVTTLDTSAVQDDQAGYFAKEHPSLDRQAGYTLQFTSQIMEEAHTTPHRAGFSIILLSDDLLGIELGFWSNEIWAQEGGTSALFTHAEGVNFDATAALIEYELRIAANTYTLSAEGTEILTGPLRDYTAFEGVLDPYETPNLLFLGDNTSRGKAKVNIAYVALQTISTATSTPTLSATAENTPTQEPTSTPTPAATPTATATTIPTPQPIRSWSWWFPMTAGYPSQ